ncbi:MAG: O-antigen ligase family protein [bacterium]|nr:O-antigen ligase family protein [bacterium]
MLFTILFFIFAWRRLDWAVMFLIATLPAYLIRFNVFGLPSTILEAMIWIVFMVWIINNFGRVKNNFLENFKKNNQKIKIRYPFDWEMVLLLLIALMAVSVAGFSSSSFGIWKAYFFEPVLFFIVVLNVFKYNAKAANEMRMPRMKYPLEKILWSLAISALTVSALAIYQKLTGAFIDNPAWADENTRRVVSFFGYPNAVGLYLGPLVLVMIGWLFNVILERSESGAIGSQGDSIGRRWRSFLQNDKMRIVFIALIIIMSVFSIYFAKSKGALLGVATGLIIFGLMASKKIRYATIILLLLIGFGLAVYQSARNLAVENITFSNLSGQIRKAGWSDTWRMLKNGHLITGAGLANYQAAVAPYHTEGIFFKDPNDPEAQRKLVFNEAYRTAHWQPLEIYLYPHNIILNFWSELGLAGLLIFIWIIFKYFWLGISGLSLRGANADPSPPTDGSGQASQSYEQDDRRLLRSLQSLAMTDKFLLLGLICAMVVIIIHGLVDAPYFKNDLAVMFWLFMAMMSLIKLESLNN